MHGRHGPAARLREVADHDEPMRAPAQCLTQVLHQADRIRVTIITIAMTPDADEAGARGRQCLCARDATVRRGPDNGGRSRGRRRDPRPGGRLGHGGDE